VSRRKECLARDYRWRQRAGGGDVRRAPRRSLAGGRDHRRNLGILDDRLGHPGDDGLAARRRGGRQRRLDRRPGHLGWGGFRCGGRGSADSLGRGGRLPRDRLSDRGRRHGPFRPGSRRHGRQLGLRVGIGGRVRRCRASRHVESGVNGGQVSPL